MSSAETIKQFGEYDYDRLMDDDDNQEADVMKICLVPDDLQELARKLQQLIRQGRLHVMDKESGVAFPASVVIGFDGNGLLIANER